MNAAPIEELRKALAYSPETGVLVWARSSRRVKVGMRAGSRRKDGYVQVHACGRLWMAHRLAWLLTFGVMPSGDIDHIDGDPSNNRLDNLRDVSRLLNMQNQRKAHRSNKSSGLLGVSFDAKNSSWLAKISLQGRTKNIGRFATAASAHAAYIAAKRALHSGSTL